MASGLTCGRGLLVNSQRSIFYIGNPNKGHGKVDGYMSQMMKIGNRWAIPVVSYNRIYQTWSIIGCLRYQEHIIIV